MGFTKLDEDIFDSSLTPLGPIPFAVFVLLLAKAKPPDGIARVAPSVIAGRLLISREECVRAFEVLQAPDPESRTPDDEGRRIERADGGWRVINYWKYREKRDPEIRREQTRAAMRKMRDKKSRVSQCEPVVSQCEPPLAQAEAEAEVQVPFVGSSSLSVLQSSLDMYPPEQRPENSSASALAKIAIPVAKPVNWTAEATEIWNDKFAGTAKYGRIGRALKDLVHLHGWAFVRKAWINYLLSVDNSQYASPEHFAESLFGKFSGLRREPPPKDDISAHNSRLVDDATWNREMSKLGQMAKPIQKLKG